MSNSLNALIVQADQLLPQTQCGLCGHRAGCLPYAQAMVEQGENANKCIPGGQPVADALARLLQRPPLPAEPSVWAVQADGRPQRMKAVIREDECIGCTKCISACPVDAIIGSGKLMHTVMPDLCTGCELCLAPCPVDCIDLVEDESPLPTEQQRIAEQNDLRERYKAHLLREQIRRQKRLSARPITQATTSQQHISAIIGQDISETATPNHKTRDAKTTIALAKLRTQIKKLQAQLAQQADEAKQQQLLALQQQLAELSE